MSQIRGVPLWCLQPYRPVLKKNKICCLKCARIKRWKQLKTVVWFCKKAKQIATPFRSHLKVIHWSLWTSARAQSQTVWWNMQQALCKFCIVRTFSTTRFYHHINTNNTSANMSYPGASSGFKIWKNWHQDSLGLIAPSCVIYLSDQMSIQNSIVATLLMGKMATFISYWHE